MPNGTVVYEPAILTPGLAGTGYGAGLPGPRLDSQVSPGGLSLTGDGGRRWAFAAPGGATWVPQDDAIYVDRTTGRIFFYALSPDPVPDSGKVPPQDQLPAGQAHVLASGDGGRSWSEAALAGYVESENPRFTSAPAPRGGARPVGYSDVTYWCGNNVVKAGLPVPSYRACYRSMDGGVTWQFASILSSYPVPQQPACGTNGETLQDSDPNYPEGAPDGSLYVEDQCGSSTFLARSTDEAATWRLVATRGTPVVLPADGELRIGSNGELFLAFQNAAGAVVVATSMDGGHTWAKPMQLTPPGLGPISQWAMAERGRGTVALSVLAARGTTSVYDGWVVYTSDINAKAPVLWAVSVNPTGRPMRTSDPVPARDDYIGVDVGPDGTPWVSFAASCPGPVGGEAACAGQSSNPEANEAIAGRLAFWH
ncbi:MAG TPA: sialidase family protein [Acidimicrobiales bacterium]|nr:sialidase family protein [Acidimicrobiales bacterium]